MDAYDTNVTILMGLDEIMPAIKHLLLASDYDDDHRVYVSGGNTGRIIDMMISQTKNVRFSNRLCILIPNLVSSGRFFRSKAAADGSHIKISNYAVHDLIVSKNISVHFSIHDDQLRDRLIMGVINHDKPTILALNTYLNELWGNSLPLVTGLDNRKHIVRHFHVKND